MTILHPARRPLNITFDEDVILDMMIALRVLGIITDERVLADVMTRIAWIECL